MLRRIANEIVERHGGAGELALVGIRTGGLFLAQRLQKFVGEIEQTEPPLGAVDITLYRDDVFQGLPRPEIGTETSVPRPQSCRLRNETQRACLKCSSRTEA